MCLKFKILTVFYWKQTSAYHPKQQTVKQNCLGYVYMLISFQWFNVNEHQLVKIDLDHQSFIEYLSSGYQLLWIVWIVREYRCHQQRQTIKAFYQTLMHRFFVFVFFLDMFFLDLCHEIDWKFKVPFIVFGQGAKQNANIPNFEFFFSNTTTNSTFSLESIGSVGKSADSAFLSASVDDPDDAFVGFTYVPPTDLTEWVSTNNLTWM